MIAIRSNAFAAALCCLALAACGASDTSQQDNQANPSAAAEGPAAAASTVPLTRTAGDPALQWGPCPEGFPDGCELTVLQGDPAQDNADMMLRVPGGMTIPPHSHSSAERMILVDGVMEVKYAGAPAALLREDSYAYGPAGLPHRAECRSSDPCVLFIAFVGPVDAPLFEGSVD